jgi:hypothetical protein
MTTAETEKLYARSTDGLVFKKATKSYDGPNDCLEVASFPDRVVALRDSKHRDGSALMFTPGEWSAFTAGVRAGEFG